MRTTISLDERVLAKAKERAHARRITLGAYIEQAVRRDLVADEEADVEVPTFPVFTRGTGVAPGVDATTNRGLYDALDG
jgi:hypothetical protein